MLQLQLGHLVVFDFQLLGQPVDVTPQGLTFLPVPAHRRLMLLVILLLIILNGGSHGVNHSRFTGARRSDQKHIQAGLLVMPDVALDFDRALQACSQHAESDPGSHIHRCLGVDSHRLHIGAQLWRQAFHRKGWQGIRVGLQRHKGKERPGRGCCAHIGSDVFRVVRVFSRRYGFHKSS